MILRTTLGARLASAGRSAIPRAPGRPLALLARIGAGALVLATLYYGVLGTLMHRIDNDLDFVPPAPVEGGSAAVAMASALIDREVNEHGWSANNPWLYPDAFLDNMPNYQTGLMRSVGRFTFHFLDQLARTRGSSSVDPDLERANGLLQFPGDVWIFDPRSSLLPTIPSEQQYRAGLAALVAYNARLAEGRAVFERRGDALAMTLRRVSADLGSQTALLDRRVQQDGLSLLDRTADDAFYLNKGMLYGYTMLLRALGQDFEAQIAERALNALWAQTLASLGHAASLKPPIVLNGAGDNSIFANPLVLQGFYMKRAILQLEEIVDSLSF
jgi:hypothetical protein